MILDALKQDQWHWVSSAPVRAGLAGAFLAGAVLLSAPPTIGQSSGSAAPATRETGASPGPTTKPKARARANQAIYKAPDRGAPSCNKVGGGRSGVDEQLDVALLAPVHPGLTTERSPTLFWLLSAPTRHRVEWAITRDDRVDPEVPEAVLDGSRAGLQRINLADLGVKLEVGHSYEWVVAVVMDEEHRANDIVASGAIQPVAKTEALSRELSEALDPIERAAVLAGYPYPVAKYVGYEASVPKDNTQGLWYDAVSELASAGGSDAAAAAALTALITSANPTIPPTLAHTDAGNRSMPAKR